MVYGSLLIQHGLKTLVLASTIVSATASSSELLPRHQPSSRSIVPVFSDHTKVPMALPLALPYDAQVLQLVSSAIVAQQLSTMPARPRKLTAAEARQLQQLIARSPGRTVIIEHTFRVNVPTFGSCLFVPVLDLSHGAPKLALHLVTNNRIVYTFPQPTWARPWTILEVKAVGFMELNFDGGDSDIVLVANYTAGPSGPGTSPPFPVVLVYLTEERGYALDDEISQILTQRRVATIAEAETIMRREFQYLP